MNIFKQGSEYGLIKISDDCWRVVKVLKEYDSHDEASNDLIELVEGSKEESDI